VTDRGEAVALPKVVCGDVGFAYRLDAYLAGGGGGGYLGGEECRGDVARAVLGFDGDLDY
jgi:hypothetical protein